MSWSRLFHSKLPVASCLTLNWPWQFGCDELAMGELTMANCHKPILRWDSMKFQIQELYHHCAARVGCRLISESLHAVSFWTRLMLKSQKKSRIPCDIFVKIWLFKNNSSFWNVYFNAIHLVDWIHARRREHLLFLTIPYFYGLKI